jgi:hypothetical protein
LAVRGQKLVLALELPQPALPDGAKKERARARFKEKDRIVRFVRRNQKKRSHKTRDAKVGNARCFRQGTDQFGMPRKGKEEVEVAATEVFDCGVKGKLKSGTSGGENVDSGDISEANEIDGGWPGGWMGRQGREGADLDLERRSVDVCEFAESLSLGELHNS